MLILLSLQLSQGWGGSGERTAPDVPRMMAYNRGGVALRIAPADWFRGEAGVRSVAQSLTRQILPRRDIHTGIVQGIGIELATLPLPCEQTQHRKQKS